MSDQTENAPRQVHALQDTLGSPYVVKTPGVCGGAARLIRTRIPIWAIEQLTRDGADDAEILAGRPTLTAEDLVHARRYSQMFKEEIDSAIKWNEKDFDGQTTPQ